MAAAFSTSACILMVVGAARYVDRLPRDWVGIGLYIAAAVGFAAAAFGFYVNSRREKAGEGQQPPQEQGE